jgi:hypothetical protein
MAASPIDGDKRLFTPGPLNTTATVKAAMLHDFGSRDGTPYSPVFPPAFSRPSSARAFLTGFPPRPRSFLRATKCPSLTWSARSARVF